VELTCFLLLSPAFTSLAQGKEVAAEQVNVAVNFQVGIQ
jgi:hypothetical protein